MDKDRLTAGDVISGMMFCCAMFGVMMLDYSMVAGLVLIAVGIAPGVLALAAIALERIGTWAAGLWRRYIEYCKEAGE